jgi:UDP-N-acetylmuramate--alanine ligase
MGLLNFKGVQRRFNKIFSFKGINFYDDYAHHPTEIKEVLNGVSKIYKKFEKICIFQPHRVSRLNLLRKEFTLAFEKADTVILCPVYNAGEKIKLKFSYLKFARQIIKNSKVKLFMISNLNELIKFLKPSMFGKKIIIGMGAGSISSWMKEIARSIK